MNNEKGHALPLALLALLVGTLVITPFLTHVGTGLIARGIYGEAIIDHHSAEAGIDYAIWGLKTGNFTVPEGRRRPLPPFTINDKAVNVTIKNVVDSWPFRVATYEITSTAGGTTIEVHVEVSAAWFMDPDLPIYPYACDFVLDRGREYSHNVYRRRDVILHEDAKIVREADVYVYAGRDVTLYHEAAIEAEGSVYTYAGRNMTLYPDAEIEAEGSVYVYVGGNMTVHGADMIPPGEAEIEAEGGGVYVYVGGDMILHGKGEIEAEGGGVYVNVGRDMILQSEAEIEAKKSVYVNVVGNMILHDRAEIEAEKGGNVTIHVWGNLTIGKDAEIEATGGGRVLICVHGNVTLGYGVEIRGDFHVAGTVTIGAGAKITGNIYIHDIRNLIIELGGEHDGEVRLYGGCRWSPPLLPMVNAISKIVTWETR